MQVITKTEMDRVIHPSWTHQGVEAAAKQHFRWIPLDYFLQAEFGMLHLIVRWSIFHFQELEKEMRIIIIKLG